ncbi:unnamed protein product, partial [Laminaria digitata]
MPREYGNRTVRISLAPPGEQRSWLLRHVAGRGCEG